MSFFSNLMSSLGPNTPSSTTQQQKPALPAPNPASTPSRSNEKPSNKTINTISTSQSATSSNLKRKADNPDRNTPPKKAGISGLDSSKTDLSSRQTSSIAPRPRTLAPNASRTSDTKLSSVSAKGSLSTNQKPLTNTSASQATTTGSNSSTANSTKPAPKKNSYREIMARAALASQQQGSIGQIKHKAASKLNRRDRQRLELKQKHEKQQQQHLKTGDDSRNAPSLNGAGSNSKDREGLGGANTSKTSGSRKPGRQPLSYAGTARPSTSQPNPNANPNSSSANGQRYTYYSSASGSEDGEDYDEDDYDEDDDDMEGGGFDELEAEEEASLRAARKEDMQALMEEEQHRKEKLARKAALEQLQKRRAGRS